jgi:hypothetical protein
MTSFTIKIHASEFKIDAKNETTPSANHVRKGTAISMASSMTIPTSNVP